MQWSRRKRPSRLRALRGAALIVALTSAAALAGCSSGASPAPATSAPVDVVKDLDFAQPDGTQLQLDACTPQGATDALPAVVIVHSGSWTEGSHGDLDWLCEEGARHGFAAFTVDYRLLPSAFPSQLEDVVSAVDWISADAQAKRFHVDPKRVALLGTSAGGAIVGELLTGVPGSPVPPSRFIGGAMLSGIFDFPSIVSAATGSSQQQVALDYAGCATTECSRLDDVSAAQHVDAGDPPMFLANSTTELMPLDQATTMAAALQAAGVRHELEIATSGTDHAEFIALNHRDIDAKMWTFLESLAR
jgi:acetyl esterase